jgi:hypothetical protein
MNKKYFITCLLFVIAPLAFAYTSIDGVTNDRNTDPINVDKTGGSSCVTVVSSNLRYKMSDQNTSGEVTNLQNFLVSLSLLKASPTGYFGAGTLSAVKQFQKMNGLTPTGYVGALTKSKIRELSCQQTEASQEPSVKVTQTIPTVLKKEAVVACTMEARFCADGSFMPRDTQTCAWLESKCPAAKVSKIVPLPAETPNEKGKSTSSETSIVKYQYDPLPPVIKQPTITPPQVLKKSIRICPAVMRLCPNGEPMAQDENCAWLENTCQVNGNTLPLQEQ